MKHIIKSKERGLYFVAIHSYTPMFGKKEYAKKFEHFDEAFRYAMDELFTSESAFDIEKIP